MRKFAICIVLLCGCAAEVESASQIESGLGEVGCPVDDCLPATEAQIHFCQDIESYSRAFSACETIPPEYLSCWDGLDKGSRCCCHTGTCVSG